MVELPILTSGAGFSGRKNGINTWEKHRNINSWASEFGEKAIYVTFNWNMTVNIWLKNYILDRLQVKSFQVKLVLTRIAASLFHGIYSGYHVFFFFTVPHTLFFTPCLQYFFGHSREYVAKGEHFKSWVVYLLRSYLTAWIMNGYGSALVWHEPKDWIAQGNSQLWLPHFILIGCFVFKTMVIDPQKKKTKKLK